MLFRLTEQGKSVYQMLLGSTPVNPPTPDGGDRRRNATSLEHQAIEIAERLERSSTAGGDGKDFEEATQCAFAFLGFDTQLIGGSGNPDVLANASMGEKSYRILIDSKSRASGTVQQNDVPYPALLKQKASASANYVVVIGPGFAGGQLAEFAQQHQIRLMTTADLKDQMLAHARSAFPLDILEPLFRGGGPVDEGILLTIQSSSESGAEMIELARKVFMAVKDFQDKAAAINCDSLYFILGCAHDVASVQMAVAFLQSELIGAIGASTHGSLYTRLSPQTLQYSLHRLPTR